MSLKRIFRYGIILAITGFLLASVTAAGIWHYLAPKLPEAEVLRDVRFQVPLRIYSADGRLIAEYGEKRRAPVTYEQIPPRIIQAFLAAEDDRYFEHPGVDWQGLMRAFLHLVKTGEKGQGGSTITMQVARNFFLGSEKTYLRKLNEIILSFKIEEKLSKEAILELYLNKIYLGQRSYGIGAAASIYYGKTLDELDLPQVAMIAGLPKAPSRYNPISDPKRAVTRRNYVLRRMLELDYISQEEFQQATTAAVSARLRGLDIEVDASYVGEMVRSRMLERYGDSAYTDGFKVITTIDSRLQQVARRAVRQNLIDYSKRHGYRGPLKNISLSDEDTAGQWEEVLRRYPVVSGLRPALVLQTGEQSVTAFQLSYGEFEILWPGLEWARPYINENRKGKKPATAADILTAGDIIYVELNSEGEWELSQVPRVEGALVSIKPEDGRLVALTGGFNFKRSKFNRATQAKRQPGSNFKPFIYSAALESGYTAASTVNDAPVVFDDPGLESTWRPENYSGKFFGPTRLREALTKSRNLVSIRLLRDIGIRHALNFVRRFGFDTSYFPRDLSLALGSISLSPLEVATGYAVFANGGFLVKPYFIDSILDYSEQVIFKHVPATACPLCETAAQQQEEQPAGTDEMPAPLQVTVELPEKPAHRAISKQNNWLMNSIMRDVITRGTGRRAMKLGRHDLAGKTGTTNDQKDAWFSGFNHHLATTAWVGFDDLQKLGSRETGGRAALPMWMSFMKVALEGVEEKPFREPEGMITVRIDPATGQRVSADFPSAILESFRAQYAPREISIANGEHRKPIREQPANITEQLF